RGRDADRRAGRGRVQRTGHRPRRLPPAARPRSAPRGLRPRLTPSGPAPFGDRRGRVGTIGRSMRAEDTDRTRLLAREAGRWVLPHWMERQLDPASPAWEPDLGAGPLANVAARDVTPVGTVGSAHVATIDPRGLVTPTPG